MRRPPREVPAPVNFIPISVCPSFPHCPQRLRQQNGSEFTGSLSHFGAGFSVQGLADKGPSFQELLEVHTLGETSETMH